MSRWLALAETPDITSTPCDNLTEPDKTQPVHENRGFVTYCQLSHGNDCKPQRPDIDAFEERAAIAEFDGGLTRREAEHLAAQSQGFHNVVAFKASQARAKSRTGP
jgi:hypothetical protein